MLCFIIICLWLFMVARLVISPFCILLHTLTKKNQLNKTFKEYSLRWSFTKPGNYTIILISPHVIGLRPRDYKINKVQVFKSRASKLCLVFSKLSPKSQKLQIWLCMTRLKCFNGYELPLTLFFLKFLSFLFSI